ncbi:hypothetical protein Poli38472_005784 [Pythium oligandrum]|uniref:Uncharacterized protein n=1 Tax=Pythium oligandrum TaxID=41045 RepID=A0A8K1CR61_PYTOL|nr:hypothetical protein Poli38472_005784 [Pythium oligandrum]|eukprot:TMW68316.1 hypothetical protein Poli38472_005784 [Pythium oligandrum]
MAKMEMRNVFPSHLLACFPYETMNRVQEKVLPPAFHAQGNMMVCAPTGSGKTSVFEAAFLQMHERSRGDAKVKAVYIAPVKALLQERLGDWQKRFGASTLSMAFVELSGDTRDVGVQEVVGAQVILTTPEKWEAVMRSEEPWSGIVRSVELLLIDEAHHIGDSPRGAVLETTLCRMMRLSTIESAQKLSGCGIARLRIIAVSATFSNCDEFAGWINCSSRMLFQFGHEYRPVPLECHVFGFKKASNQFMHEQNLDSHVMPIVRKFADGKPTVVFCNSRGASIRLARHISSVTLRTGTVDLVKLERQNELNEAFLRGCSKTLIDDLSCGVGYHHAGLRAQDRALIEDLFRRNLLSILCCTSSLAVGINLPAHLVIIKSTSIYQGSAEAEEYSPWSVLQMIGRAGRPGYDTSGVAVIMTEPDLVNSYEYLCSGKRSLRIESGVETQLSKMLNTEIALGCVKSTSEAISWLKTTFYGIQTLNRHSDSQEIAEKKISLAVTHLLRLGLKKLKGSYWQQSSISLW